MANFFSDFSREKNILKIEVDSRVYYERKFYVWNIFLTNNRNKHSNTVKGITIANIKSSLQ